ncbi:NAD(+)/NADH kinase [Streptomyces sp. NPDC013157]|uniref:NAD(+)/NADH kinase n=1 Tax=Streptomyces sp. NPDC013157 TaxID=3364861 RepID=UPI0036AB96FC
MTVNGLGLVVHGGRAEAVEAACAVRAWAAEHDVRCTDIDVWHDGGRHHSGEEVAAAGDPDLIVTLGGDGTFLRGARLAARNDALVLGVDLGRVGFLTEVPVCSVREALDAIREDRYTVDSRLLLTMRASRRLEVPADMERLMQYGRGPLLPPPQVRTDCEQDTDWGVPLHVAAVNDIVLEKLSRDRQVSVGVYVSGRLLASYSADALLVATPTGSTAYSFAAGGPVVSPCAEALVFTPVAPHMTFNRSVVTAPNEAVGLRVLERSGQAAVSVDGQVRGVLEPGDWIGVYAAPTRLRVVRLAAMDFYGRLRERMNLTDAPAAVADGTPAPLWSLRTPPPGDMAHISLPLMAADYIDAKEPCADWRERVGPAQAKLEKSAFPRHGQEGDENP